MNDVLVREHTDGVIAALEAAELAVGDAEGELEGEDLQAPYCVVYSIPGGSRGGSLENPHEDAELVYQVTCVGETRRQAEWVADKANVLLAGFPVTGRSIAFVEISSNPGVRRDDTVSPPLFYATPRYRIKSTPA